MVTISPFIVQFLYNEILRYFLFSKSFFFKYNLSSTFFSIISDNYVWDRNNQVRELTNYEAFRLMDVDEADTLKLLETIPKSQCKKLAGNSICVNVLTELFREMFNRKENPEKSLF